MLSFALLEQRRGFLLLGTRRVRPVCEQRGELMVFRERLREPRHFRGVFGGEPLLAGFLFGECRFSARAFDAHGFEIGSRLVQRSA